MISCSVVILCYFIKKVDVVGVGGVFFIGERKLGDFLLIKVECGA